MDERTLQAAAAALEKGWLKLATPKELQLLELSGQRPALFESKDDGELRILFHPSMGLEPMTASVQQGEVSANAAELVFRRTRLRTRLGLPAHDCAAKRPNDDCTCLTATLDELSDEELAQLSDKAPVLAAARKVHKRRPARLWLKPSQSSKQPTATPQAATVERASPLHDPLTETSTKPALKPRFRRSHGPPDPLSYAAFKRDQGGPSIRGMADRKF